MRVCFAQFCYLMIKETDSPRHSAKSLTSARYVDRVGEIENMVRREHGALSKVQSRDKKSVEKF